ncbi:MBL fold metallo-hydrolase [Sphingobium boeckii]|uniref:7, 8-dihydropterin-6-yl-methyl-4-(Beta-D-ribofuranosyl)aminobenzene 5'-phosphate synthase n=1 Tax=Sphingobium boeckii TaxID=1082345 RepID=A0A7W9EEQ7_9SPHN|nr:MBL fold metallo-hydrolase [Sphingobium boeckii]MBB5684921.1 7,8-dihydropterin-6-yl-methyl-4-(beta-D-ribofuranosyl)aminobenzene 5'-phosphate synthase [Sphingobium boeckii]
MNTLHGSQTPIVGRRTALGLIAIGLSALALPARARNITVPQVDALTLQVLIDNATFGPFLSDVSLPGVSVVRHTGDAGKPVMSRAALHAEFGLSILATSQMDRTTAKVIVDFGYTPEAVRNNLSLLGIDVSDVDAAVLSHGHLDHYGGFSGFYRENPSRRIPLYVGGEETFCERLAMIGTPPPLMGSLDREALARAGFDVRIASTPQIIKGQAFTSGTIPLSSFERAAIPTQMRPGKGCNLAGLAPAKRDVTQLPDDGEHELATCYAVKGLGLVVIASCSHRGVINSVRQAQKISGIDNVHAVIGGFHLVRPRTEEEARRTVAEFAAIDPAYIIPMHCTGDTFISAAMRVMPQKIIRSYIGTEFVFKA